MIRQLEDHFMTTNVVQMLQSAYDMTVEEISAKLAERQVLVSDEGFINGLATLKLPTEASGGKAFVSLFVDPDARRRGIGRRLWKRLIEEMAMRQPESIIVEYRSGATDLFFDSLGFVHVVDVDIMQYAGLSFPNIRLDVVPYEDGYFEDYIRVVNEAFHPLRAEVGMAPYNVFPDSAYHDEVLRQRICARGEDIMVVREGRNVAGIAELDGRFIDTIAIAEPYRGAGRGKALTQFCVNEMLKRGVSPVWLGVGRPNQRAKRLYLQLGFEEVETIRISRLSTAGFSWSAEGDGEKIG